MFILNYKDSGVIKAQGFIKKQLVDVCQSIRELLKSVSGYRQKIHGLLTKN